MDGTEAIDTSGGEAIDLTDAPRDFETEARQHGWTPKDEFRGDAAKWVDAETFAKRADEVMPFLRKQNAALKREMDDVKRQMRKSAEYFSKAEQRGYERAMTDLEKRHTEAVEMGDNVASVKIRTEMAELAESAKDIPTPAPDEKPAFDPVAARQELAAWVDDNDWYVKDADKKAYADIQAEAMGPATEWPDGNKAWLDELAGRVQRKFREPAHNPANPGGNRGAPRSGGKSFADLPPEARAACDKWVKQGIIKDRASYVTNYQWD